MGEILGLGISHWPQLGGKNEDLALRLRRTLKDPALPARDQDPANWPPRMREEWGDDHGAGHAQEHRASMATGLRAVRKALDAFAPDAIVVWGGDQYENVREDLIPAFSVLAYQHDLACKPWGGMPNFWNESMDTTFQVKSAPEIATYLATGMLEEEFDIAYAYKPLHSPNLAHAFMNTVLYLDYDRTGFPYPLIPFPVNCSGRYAIGHRGLGFPDAGAYVPRNPPSPSPKRCFDLGRAAARVLARSPWRIALVASSSWSHAFLCEKTKRLYPDIAADRRLYDAMLAGDADVWRSTTLAQVEEAGQHELLTWFCLMGAMSELHKRVTYASFTETYVYDADKVAAVFG